jgi:tetratricopeptide (TPR) repeat protein
MSPVDATNFTWFHNRSCESPPRFRQRSSIWRQKPSNSPGDYKVRASYFIHQGEYEKAIGDFNHALELNPLHSKYCNNLAWLLATCPDAEFGSSARVELAEKAIANGSQQDLKFAWNTLAVARIEMATGPERWRACRSRWNSTTAAPALTGSFWRWRIGN